MDINEKALTIPPYDGKKSEFVIWWHCFRGYANVHRFAQALTPTMGDPDLPTTENLTIANTDAGKKQAVAKC